MSDLKTNLEQILQEKQTKIIPENIKKNVEIFGITGTLEAEINTSDATATADDIINPKTAYVNGEKITGNIATTQISLETNVESETIPNTIIDSFNILYGLSEDREYLFIFENNGSQNATSNTWELKVYKKEANSYILNTTFTRENLDIDIGAYLISIGPWGLFNDDNKLLICVKHSGYNSTIFGIVYDKLSNTITMPHSISLGEFNAYGWSNANPIYPDIVANSCRISRYTETGVKNIYRNDTSYSKPYAFEGITQWSCNGEVFTIFKKNGSGTVRYFIKNYQAVKSVTTSEYVCLNTTGDYAFVDGVLKSSIVNTETGDISFEDVGTEIVAESKIIIWLDRFVYIVLTNTNNTKKDTKYSYNVYVFNESDKSTYNVGQIGFIQENDTNFGAISWGQFNKGFIGLGLDNNLNVLYNSEESFIDTLTYKNRKYYSNSDANILAENILQNKSAYNASGKIIGTMPNNGTLNYTPNTTQQTIPAGYTSGGSVSGDSNLIPENIKKDIEIFDVIGTYEGSNSSNNAAKIFETEEEMQADENAQEGDLAVVYRSEIQNMTVDTQTQYITFPETVTLPEAVTSDHYCMLRAIDTSVMFDGNVQLGATSFMFNGYTDTGMIRVEYSSTDGITYNRTRFENDNGDLTNPVDLGTTIQVYISEEWNDNMGYFMQIGGNIFEGLYKYNGAQYYLAPTQLTTTKDSVYNSTYYGKDGVNEGALTLAPANTLDDTNAEVYYKLMQFYDNMEPIKVQNGQTFKNAYFITNSYGDVLLDLSEVTNASNMFNGNKYIVEYPELNTSNVTDTTFMFNDCTNLISAPEIDTSKVTAMNFMFAYDTNLSVVPVYDTSNVITMNDMFYMCPNLSDEALNNIMQMCINTTDKYTKNKTLRALAISSVLATKCTTLSNYEAFTAAGWTTGY